MIRKFPIVAAEPSHSILQGVRPPLPSSWKASQSLPVKRGVRVLAANGDDLTDSSEPSGANDPMESRGIRDP